MAEVTQLKVTMLPHQLGKWFLIGTGILVSAFILIVLMVIYIFVRAFSKGLMPVPQNLANLDMLHAIWLTVMIALITVPVNLVFGISCWRLVTRLTSSGCQLPLTLLDIPLPSRRWWRAGHICCSLWFQRPALAGWTRITCKIMFAFGWNGAGHHFVTCPLWCASWFR